MTNLAKLFSINILTALSFWQELEVKNPPLPKATADKGGDKVHGKEEKAQEEVIGKLFGALPIDQLVTTFM